MSDVKLFAIKKTASTIVSCIIQDTVNRLSGGTAPASSFRPKSSSILSTSRSPRNSTSSNMSHNRRVSSLELATGIVPPQYPINSKDRRRRGSNSSLGNMVEAMQAVKQSRNSDNSWVDDIRISFLECMLFIMWDYRKFVKRGWYKSTQSKFDTK